MWEYMLVLFLYHKEGTDLGKTEREKPDANDVNESDSGEKNEDKDHHSSSLEWFWQSTKS